MSVPISPFISLLLCPIGIHVLLSMSVSLLQWSESSSVVCDYLSAMDYMVHGILQARILEWVAVPSLGDLPNPGIRPRSLALQVILYQLSHKGSPRIMEWVAYPFSSRSSQPRNRTRVSCIEGGFFTNWAIREVQNCVYEMCVHPQIKGAVLLKAGIG